MPQTQATYGFGFSPISLENKDKAFADEMFAVKHMGLTGILYGDNKNPVSATVYNRRKQSLEKFMNEIQSRNLVGDLYILTPENNIVEITENGIIDGSNGSTDEIAIANISITKNPKHIYAYTDFDLVNTETNEMYEDISGINGKYVGRIAIGDTTYYLDSYSDMRMMDLGILHRADGSGVSWDNIGENVGTNLQLDVCMNADYDKYSLQGNLKQLKIYTYGICIYITYDN